MRDARNRRRCGQCPRVRHRCRRHRKLDVTGHGRVDGDRESGSRPSRSGPRVTSSTDVTIPSAVELRDLAASVAEIVGREVGLRRVRIGSVTTKSASGDVVTDIDTWSEEAVVQRISAVRPDDGFLGEEGTSTAGRTGIRWVIDPVDGTTNLLYDLPGYSVSIAAEVAGTAVAGAVYDPIRDELFAAATGEGATRNRIPIGVTDKTDLSTSLIGTGFSYLPENRVRQAQQLCTIIPEVRDIRRFGGAAIDLCSVACGRFDGWYERGLSPWDSAAGALIAIEAGAVVTDGDLTIAAAPGIDDALRELLERVGA